MDSFDEGDQFDNLWINNSWEDDAALDQYENEIDKNLNEHLQYEKEQSTQKLFQSFQNSACAVTQMFKDRTQIMSPWNSFQNAAGAITVLYKESLDSCKVHLDMGINMGQQRKIKELINWLRKKKRRTIRKEELVNFLMGRQTTTTNASSLNQRFSSFNRTTSRSNRNNNTNTVVPMASCLISSNNMMMTSNNVLPTNTLNNVNVNVNETSTHSDLATFREALIMHNRTRDTPPVNTNPHLNHHHQHHHHSHQHATTNPNTIASTTTTATPPPNTTTTANPNTTTTTTGTNPNCDDLDCFFCEQIARHIEHKRSATSAEMDSPTRKRSRFY